MDIDGLTIDPGEIKTQRYGPSTAAAVLAYKRKRKIINRAYQQSEDNIVGRMTIAALDKDMLDRQYVPLPAGRKPCGRFFSLQPSRLVRLTPFANHFRRPSGSGR
jgi:hypothetical protein